MRRPRFQYRPFVPPMGLRTQVPLIPVRQRPKQERVVGYAKHSHVPTRDASPPCRGAGRAQARREAWAQRRPHRRTMKRRARQQALSRLAGAAN